MFQNIIDFFKRWTCRTFWEFFTFEEVLAIGRNLEKHLLSLKALSSFWNCIKLWNHYTVCHSLSVCRVFHFQYEVNISRIHFSLCFHVFSAKSEDTDVFVFGVTICHRNDTKLSMQSQYMNYYTNEIWEEDFQSITTHISVVSSHKASIWHQKIHIWFNELWNYFYDYDTVFKMSCWRKTVTKITVTTV